MKQYTYTELVRYDKAFEEGKNDFYGELSPLDQSGTKEFFAKYLEAMKEEYGEDCLNCKAVPDSQLKEALGELKKEEKLRFIASKRRHYSGYKHWQLYTPRASIEDDTVLLEDSYQLPTAATKCEFPKTVKSLSLFVFFDEAYRRPIPGGSIITTPGKSIDLRCGITDAVRLFFAENGKLLVRANETGDVYHYKDKYLCDYPFDSEFRIDFDLSDEGYTVTALGNSLTLPYLIGPRPDTLFLSGGLQPTDFWRVRIGSAVTQSGERLDLFEEDDKESRDYPEQVIGSVELPFCIGTEKDKDNDLILKTAFIPKKGMSYALRIESLDPHGEIYINGDLACETSSFHPFTLPLDEFLEEDSDNTVELVVHPRAPELLYVWHRHNDPYNGWFSLSAELLCGKEIAYGRPTVITNGKNAPESFTVDWSTELEGNVEYKAYIRSSYPKEGQFSEISAGILSKGRLNFTNPCTYNYWSTEAPNLYEIKIDLLRNGSIVYTDTVETGFRTIAQRDGAIYLNGKKTVLKGALNMQFLPPYDQVPINHVCPTDEQITEQVLALKNLNGNCLRLHQLGHGSSDKRFGEICDRLGVLLIWTTRAIDSAEQILWNRSDSEPWRLADIYKIHMRPFLNHPSIIMWEGSNELHSGLTDLDRLYDTFVKAVREVDNTRLICPVSHLYYGGGLYGGPEVDTDYYNNDGTRAADGEEVSSSFGWLDESVVRSSHTYSLLLGYGCPWRDMVTQNWALQKELFEAKDKAYIVSEFAIIGRQNPGTEGAKNFINKDSYELPNEKAALGYCFTDDEWEISQAYQAFCAEMAIRQLRRFDADGMLWCSLWSGANNGSYLKPPIDFSGYKKLAFYRMRTGFDKCVAANESPDALLYKGYKIKPICTGLSAGSSYSLTVDILTEDGSAVCSRLYENFEANSDILTLPEFCPDFPENGYYKIKYTLNEQ